jgi:hypothetical protein
MRRGPDVRKAKIDACRYKLSERKLDLLYNAKSHQSVSTWMTHVQHGDSALRASTTLVTLTLTETNVEISNSNATLLPSISARTPFLQIGRSMSYTRDRIIHNGGYREYNE